MARKVVWTAPAWDDLEVAAAYITRDSEFYAASFVQEVRDAAASLADFPERGQTVPEFADLLHPRTLGETVPPRLQAN